MNSFRSQLQYRFVAEAKLPISVGAAPFEFRARAYERSDFGDELLALVCSTREDARDQLPLIRLHSGCLTGDAIGSLRCDCGSQLQESLRLIGESGHGVLIYLSTHEGRGIGLLNKIRAYALQDRGYDTVEANLELGFSSDARTYHGAIAVLKDLAFMRVRLISNNPTKIAALANGGIDVEERVPLHVGQSDFNRDYLLTKKVKLHHMMD